MTTLYVVISESLRHNSDHVESIYFSLPRAIAERDRLALVYPDLRFRVAPVNASDDREQS